MPEETTPTPTPQSALAQLVLFGLQELLKHAPEMFAQIVILFQKPDVTVADVDALRAEIAGSHYSDFVKETAIPKDQQT